MSILAIMGTLVIGILMLIIGKETKNKWLKIASIIPLVIALRQLAFLFSMAFH
ncbi:MAG: hypothetical protein GX947_10155 [Tissierellia bacterium]|nr:hypothetical protein [Tissierellia bacterium]